MGSNFCRFAMFSSSKDAVVVCGMVGMASNVRFHACECTCVRPSLRIRTSSS